ncbi:hypothetical protein IEO21_02478 [Rhodonia placenta]|uniref:FHF complex subunit HOOK-interacting protein C-terminal domain-containing protein n=1 Tax=Rhodonia placenta TaxID=104341 RepID=A0A8H7P7M4_9APHY|nr:hypothetical protein IEO21_02478 [Postia placenta]
MDYFSKFLRAGSQPSPKVENTLMHPDERQLSRGIKSTDVPMHLQSMVDALVWESTRTEEGGTGACLEYLLKNDVLGTLVKLSEADRPFGTQAEVLRAVQNMVVLLDEQFLVHSAVHKAVLRLLRSCVGDDIQEQLDGRNKVMGAAGNAVRSQPSEYEEDRMFRIRTYRELLMIFFHDKQWYRPEPLFSVEEEDEDEDEDEDEGEDESESEDQGVSSGIPPEGQQMSTIDGPTQAERPSSPSPSQETVTSAPASSVTMKKPEYEFLLFNYLLRFVHREGRIGDFARAGLLFLMDVAMSPSESANRSSGDALSLSSSTTSLPESQSDPTTDAALALAEYIIDGDFSEVLAAGVSAVYSLLPRKLEVRSPAPTENSQNSSMVLGNSSAELSGEEKDKLEEVREKSRAMGVEDSSSPDFKARLDHFLKLLEFLQDVLRRNIVRETADGTLDPSSLVGSAIVQSILDAVRRVFLENVLYPSILECSDADGSAVAVMSYIEIMIRTLENGQLADVLIDFLTSEDNSDDLGRNRPRHQSTLNLSGNAPPSARSATVADKEAKQRRRKSTAMVLLEMEAPESRRQSEYFTSMGRFTLKDLLLSSLRSKSPATVTAALQLFQSLLVQYCALSADRLLVVIHDPHATSFPQPAQIELIVDEKVSAVAEDDDEETFVYPGTETSGTSIASSLTVAPPIAFAQPNTTYWTHEREMGLYLTLVSRVDPNHNEDAFSTGYDHYLRDALLSIQAHICFQEDLDAETREKSKHRLNANDPILLRVLDSLRTFFSNTPEMNMALTGVLATLAICPDRSLAGWLTFAPRETSSMPNKQQPESDSFTYGDDGDDRSVDFRIEENLASETNFLPASSIDEQSRPVVHSVFHGLVSQLERYRQMVDKFDQYLMERRQGLLFSENLTDALSLALDFDPSTTPKISTQRSNSEPSTPKAKAKAKSASSFVSFLTPKKNKPAKTPAAEPTTLDSQEVTQVEW